MNSFDQSAKEGGTKKIAPSKSLYFLSAGTALAVRSFDLNFFVKKSSFHQIACWKYVAA
jgi:hypothetical protein